MHKHVYMHTCVNTHIRYIYFQSSFFLKFRIYKFAYLLKFICNPQISTCSTFIILQGHMQSSKKIELPDSTQWVEQGNTQLSCFSFCTENKRLFFVAYLVPHFLQCSAFCCLKWPLNVVLKSCLEFLSAGKLCCALHRKQVCSVISYSAVGGEFNVNEGTVYIDPGVIK